ncbi:MAG: tRNA (guanosine(46)-N7)-methyltransferase TrmB [Propionibacteriaceae bacterium]|nr:tRNA (guanosine(46)-N7)-methyltransferase TrmB [Propionibacteriaceae bacterium]
MNRPRVRRDVVSFVRRSARMNESQRKAWEAHRERFVIPVPKAATSTSIAAEAVVDWASAFGREAPLVVEIGSGIGDSLVPMAGDRPEVNVVAFEVFEPAVAQTMARLVRHGVDNVRLVIADGAQGLAQLFPDASVTELWTFFADPWHKKKHHKRRLVSEEFGTVVSRKLIPGGLWRLATDWADYAEWMRSQLDDHPGLVNVHGGWAPRYEGRPLTKFERRGLDEGREVFDLTYRRQQ